MILEEDILTLFSERDLREILESFGISPKERSFLKDVFTRINTATLRNSLKEFCGSHFIKVDKLDQYFKELLLGTIDLKYLYNRLRLGIIHEKRGVSPKFFISQFSRWLSSILGPLKKTAPSEQLLDVFALLFKCILLDIALCVEAYEVRHVERYKKIFDSMKDPVVVIALRSGNIQMLNSKLVELLQISEKEILEKGLDDICSVNMGMILDGNYRDVYLRAKDENIPVTLSSWRYELAGEEYAVFVFRDIREEIKDRKNIELLRRLYNTLSAINMLVTRVEDRDSLFKGAVNILREKGEFKYAGIFEKGKDQALIEKGTYLEKDPVICMPFKSERDEFILNIAISKGLQFTDREMSLLEEIVLDLSFALGKIKRHERLSHIAYYDEITHLPNRVYFSHALKEMMSRAKASIWKVVVIAMIIDRSVELQHTFGNRWKSEIIKAVASRIKSSTRSEDLIARIEQHTFAIAIESSDPRPIIENITGRIRSVFKDPIYINNDELAITLSFGIAQFSFDAHTPEELISNAVLAAERARELGGNREIFYSEEFTSTLKARVSIRTALRKALKKKEFVLYYQPKVELSTGRLKGAEALIRWLRNGKVILPYEFIPILEEGEIIYEVGKWVIEEACSQIKKWRKRGIEIDVSVNVSPLQLQDISSIREVISAIASCNTAGLEIEITESAVMEDVSRSISFLMALKDMGVKTYIDDFGTGYSSLAYLRRLPVYGIKIDREFVKDIPHHKHDIEIVRAAVYLAKTFGMKTVAEGPETEEQIRILKELGCDFAQGYYFSKPLPADEFEKYLLTFSGSEICGF